MQLLKSESQDQFEERYITFSAKWSKSFLEYFEAQKDELMKCPPRYNIEPWNMYNPNSGVTNNVAESLNAVL